MPPAASSSPEGESAHEFTHVVGSTIVSIRLSWPASHTTWDNKFKINSKNEPLEQYTDRTFF